MLMEDVAQQGSSLLMGMSADQSTPAPPPLPSNTAPPCFPSTPCRSRCLRLAPAPRRRLRLQGALVAFLKLQQRQ